MNMGRKIESGGGEKRREEKRREEKRGGCIGFVLKVNRRDTRHTIGRRNEKEVEVSDDGKEKKGNA